ncbi:MAG: ankyrin repeat domain-containing protein [Candidatus Micrarchaeota archaeon]
MINASTRKHIENKKPVEIHTDYKCTIKSPFALRREKELEAKAQLVAEQKAAEHKKAVLEEERKKAVWEEFAATTKKQNDSTLLFLDAVKRNHLPAMCSALDNGARINDRINGAGATALIYAAYMGYIDIVKLLLEKGADRTLKAKQDWGPLICAADNGHLELVKFFVERGVYKVDEKDECGQTPLMMACNKNHLEIIRFLVDHGSNVNEKSNVSKTPLMTAVMGDASIPVFELLLSKGANIDAQNIDGQTALMLAINHFRVAHVRFLLSKGADLYKLRDRQNKTASDLTPQESRIKDSLVNDIRELMLERMR